MLVSNKILFVMFTTKIRQEQIFLGLVLVPAVAFYNSNDARLMVACSPNSHYVAHLSAWLFKGDLDHVVLLENCATKQLPK